jgi:hypothetical protein
MRIGHLKRWPTPGEDPSRLEHRQDRRVAPGREPPALARPAQSGKFSAGEHRHQRHFHRRGAQSPDRVGAVVLDREPAQEPADRTELVTAVRSAVLAQQPHRPPLQISLVHLFPAALAGLGQDVGGGEPADRLGVGADRPRRLPLSGHVQRERLNFGLQRPRVQVLPHSRPVAQREHSFTLIPRLRHHDGVRYAWFTQIRN